jgi:hypothetical protein
MLCQQCHQQEATIHLTVIPWPPTEPTRQDFCPVCYPDAEAARVKAYNTQPPTPLRADVENITAAEFLEAADKATRNAADQPAFKYIFGQVERLPSTSDRLVFEFFQLAWEILERGQDLPSPELVLAFGWGPRDPSRLAEYFAWLEKIILRCVELRRQLPTSPGEEGPFALNIAAGLTALRRESPARFTSFVEELKKQGADPALDPRWKVIDQTENPPARPKRPKRGKK